MVKLESKAPQGPLADKWSKHKAEIKVVSPANKRKLDIIVVGTGLGGASAAASLGELGYNVKVFCISDSPRPASPRREASTPPKTTRTTTTRYTVFFTIRSRAATTAPAKPTYTVWPKYRIILSTSASHRAFRSPAITADCSTTVRSAVRRFRVRFTPAARPDSSCCSALTLR